MSKASRREGKEEKLTSGNDDGMSVNQSKGIYLPTLRESRCRVATRRQVHAVIAVSIGAR